MKASRILALAAVCATLATGCDAVRSALGKPTSKDIAALRAQREQMQHTGDSLAWEMGAAPDSDTTAPASVCPGADSISGAMASAAPLYAAATSPQAAPEQTAPDAGSDAPVQQSGTSPEGTAATEEEYVAEGLAEGFWVVLGSFKNEDNARYFYNSLSASGTEVELVKMKNGFTAVMICHGNSYDEAYSKMLKFYSDKKRPEDIWIYNTAKKMHIE